MALLTLKCTNRWFGEFDFQTFQYGFSHSFYFNYTFNVALAKLKYIFRMGRSGEDMMEQFSIKIEPWATHKPG